MPVATNLELFADYHQIHVMDEESEGDFADAWTEQTALDGLGVTDGALAIGTAVNVTGGRAAAIGAGALQIINLRTSALDSAAQAGCSKAS